MISIKSKSTGRKRLGREIINFGRNKKEKIILPTVCDISTSISLFFIQRISNRSFTE